MTTPPLTNVRTKIAIMHATDHAKDLKRELQLIIETAPTDDIRNTYTEAYNGLQLVAKAMLRGWALVDNEDKQ